jgi:hypothetical protein
VGNCADGSAGDCAPSQEGVGRRTSV